jgi:uncharacterized protein YqhQ
MSDNKDNDEKDKQIHASNNANVVALFIIMFLWVWIIAGVTAFFASLICFGFNGSTSDKFLGLIILLILGPFYWFYFIFNSSYCTR